MPDLIVLQCQFLQNHHMDGRAVAVATTASSWDHIKYVSNVICGYVCFPSSEISVYPLRFPHQVESFFPLVYLIPIIIDHLQNVSQVYLRLFGCATSSALRCWKYCTNYRGFWTKSKCCYVLYLPTAKPPAKCSYSC